MTIPTHVINNMIVVRDSVAQSFTPILVKSLLMHRIGLIIGHIFPTWLIYITILQTLNLKALEFA